MALIKTVDPDEAQGVIKEVYDQMKALAGFVPKPLQMLSASEKVFEISTLGLKFYMTHPTLNPILLAHIRFMAATLGDFPYCIDMNKQILTTMGGLTDDQALALIGNPGSCSLPDKDKAMLVFVAKAMKTPEDVQQEDVDKLREIGWTDTDIFDAVNHGAQMNTGGLLFNVFKMGI
jgi:alkylhydroperoxidase family enzyme